MSAFPKRHYVGKEKAPNLEHPPLRVAIQTKPLESVVFNGKLPNGCNSGLGWHDEVPRFCAAFEEHEQYYRH